MNLYLVRNKISGKCYIGQTTGDFRARWRGHIYSAKKLAPHQSALAAAIRKYGKSSFEVSLLKTCRSQAELDSEERQFIAFFNSRVPFGYNIANGGWGRGKHSAETKAKLSAAKKGKPGRKLTIQEIEALRQPIA